MTAGSETNNASTGTHDVYDVAGNKATAGPVSGNKVDRKAPTITLDVAAPRPTFTLGQSPAKVTGTVADGGPGLASPTVSPDADTSSVGAKQVGLTAPDKVGNSSTISAPCTVVFEWSGFFSPVDDPPTFNVAKAGSAIPVKVSLSGSQGLLIFAPGYPRYVRTTEAGSVGEDVVEETVTAGASGLNHDPVANQCIYVWKTDKALAGTCQQLQVKLTDGTVHFADFRFSEWIAEDLLRALRRAGRRQPSRPSAVTPPTVVSVSGSVRECGVRR